MSLSFFLMQTLDPVKTAEKIMFTYKKLKEARL